MLLFIESDESVTVQINMYGRDVCNNVCECLNCNQCVNGVFVCHICATGLCWLFKLTIHMWQTVKHFSFAHYQLL